jgi:hypothetical protein
MSFTTSPPNPAKLAWVAHGPRSLPALSTVTAEKSAAVTVAELTAAAELTAEAAEFTAEDACRGTVREFELSALALNMTSMQINRDW